METANRDQEVERPVGKRHIERAPAPRTGQILNIEPAIHHVDRSLRDVETLIDRSGLGEHLADRPKAQPNLEDPLLLHRLGFDDVEEVWINIKEGRVEFMERFDRVIGDPQVFAQVGAAKFVPEGRVRPIDFLLRDNSLTDSVSQASRRSMTGAHSIVIGVENSARKPHDPARSKQFG